MNLPTKLKLIFLLQLLSITFKFNLIIGQTWTQLSNFPGDPRDDGSSFVVSNKAYCLTGAAAGTGCKGDGFVFDFNTNLWNSMAALPVGEERQYASAFSYSVFGYLLCGIDNSGNVLNDFWRYNSLNDTWTQLPDFPGGNRMGAQCFMIGSKAYIISGKNGASINYNDVWEFDCVSQSWTQKNNLPFPGLWRGVGFQINNDGYVGFGLMNVLSGIYNKNLYKYNSIADSWQQINGIVLPSLTYVGCNVIQNKALFYSGQDSLATNFPNTVLVFDPVMSALTATLSGISGKPTKGGMCFTNGNDFFITTGMQAGFGRTSETYKLNTPVGLKEKSFLKFNVFPNPVNARIQISSDNQFNTIIIYNSIGEKMLHLTNLESKQYKLDLEGLSKGLYTLSIDGIQMKLIKSDN